MPTIPEPTFYEAIQQTILENKYFFFGFGIFLLVTGIGLIVLDQGDLLLYFSENRSPYLNQLFKISTALGEECTFIGFLIFFLFIRYRYALLIPLTGLLVMIISFLSKGFFQHPRPMTHYKKLGTFQDIELVEGVYVVKGLTSFPSGHTMAGFALFAMVAFCLKSKNSVGILLLFLAIMVGLSRIYLVQHFLKDVFLGSLMGVVIALLIYSWQRSIPEHKMDGKFL